MHAQIHTLGINSGRHRTVTNLSGLAVSTLHKPVTENKCTGVLDKCKVFKENTEVYFFFCALNGTIFILSFSS